MADLGSSLTTMDWLHRLKVGKSIVPCGTSNFNGTTYSFESVYNPTETQNADILEEQFDHASPPTQQIRRYGKPPYSYANLIALAINSTSKKRMTLSDIYTWICDHFPYYKTAANGWKNSIRHNLSLNRCFHRVPRGNDDPGKGSYWAIQTLSNDDSSPSVRNRKRRPDNEIPTSSNSERIETVHLYTYQQSPSNVSSSSSDNSNLSPWFSTAPCTPPSSLESTHLQPGNSTELPTSLEATNTLSLDPVKSFDELNISINNFYKTISENSPGITNLDLSSSDWLQNFNSLKESMRTYGSDWQNIDMSSFQGSFVASLNSILSPDQTVQVEETHALNIQHTDDVDEDDFEWDKLL